ncbi:MAG: hypothetical protein WD359_07830, partial [Dehalococcoidia bacterium]
MTVVERNARAIDRANEYVVRRLQERDQIRHMLEARRTYAAYALGQLDPVLFRMSEWWGAHGVGGQAVILHSHGGLGSATFVMGDSAPLEALLQTHPGPRQTFFTCEVHHLDTVLRYFDLEQRQTMIRMHVTGDRFKAAEGEARR